MAGEPDLPPDVLEALHRGRRNEAVALLRREWGIGWVEAQRHLEHYEASHALPRRDDPSNMITEDRTGTRLAWVIVLAAAATAAFFYFQ
ncbi:MAG: hypothetical protein DIU71_01195 [Proteobacteria bacterium]|nr:MAG: hypothetical protein DIU71_01195 [Pseudomonadota bacterium]